MRFFYSLVPLEYTNKQHYTKPGSYSPLLPSKQSPWKCMHSSAMYGKLHGISFLWAFLVPLAIPLECPKLFKMFDPVSWFSVWGIRKSHMMLGWVNTANEQCHFCFHLDNEYRITFHCYDRGTTARVPFFQSFLLTLSLNHFMISAWTMD